MRKLWFMLGRVSGFTWFVVACVGSYMLALIPALYFKWPMCVDGNHSLEFLGAFIGPAILVVLVGMYEAALHLGRWARTQLKDYKPPEPARAITDCQCLCVVGMCSWCKSRLSITEDEAAMLERVDTRLSATVWDQATCTSRYDP